MNIDGPGTGDSEASQHSSAVGSDGDSLRFRGFIGSIGSILTGDFGQADVEDADEDHAGETQPAPAPDSQRSFEA